MSHSERKKSFEKPDSPVKECICPTCAECVLSDDSLWGRGGGRVARVEKEWRRGDGGERKRKRVTEKVTERNEKGVGGRDEAGETAERNGGKA